MVKSIPFENVNWNCIPQTEHKGECGIAYWKTLEVGTLRLRIVEYSPGYKADHWCQKGHIIYCIEGEMVTELEDGSGYILRKGMSYHVYDNLSSHRTTSRNGAKLFIVDGDFLK